MEGLGARTFSDGKVKSGRWVEGKLRTPLPGWQCHNAVRGARDAAAAAHRVARRGRSTSDIVKGAHIHPKRILCGVCASYCRRL
jgi:hypothetical protein